MSDQSAAIAFHIGAHKTATSHLQQSLLAQTAPLAGAGVCYLGPSRLRGAGPSISALFGLPAGKPQITALCQQYQRVVISEENYIGALNPPRRRPVVTRYPDAATRIDTLASAAGQKIDIFLGLRRPTAYLNAAYCQQLLGGRITPMAQYRKLHPLASVDWLHLVARLRSTAGVGRLVVWCYEDYATHFDAIIAGLVGPAQASLVAPIKRRIHASLSAPAVAEVLHRQTRDDAPDLAMIARRLLSVDDGYPRFDGFPPQDHAASDAAYAAQIAAIGALKGVTLLDPLWLTRAVRA
jgi:hypothetical protein